MKVWLRKLYTSMKPEGITPSEVRKEIFRELFQPKVWYSYTNGAILFTYLGWITYSIFTFDWTTILLLSASLIGIILLMIAGAVATITNRKNVEEFGEITRIKKLALTEEEMGILDRLLKEFELNAKVRHRDEDVEKVRGYSTKDAIHLALYCIPRFLDDVIVPDTEEAIEANKAIDEGLGHD